MWTRGSQSWPAIAITLAAIGCSSQETARGSRDASPSSTDAGRRLDTAADAGAPGSSDAPPGLRDAPSTTDVLGGFSDGLPVLRDSSATPDASVPDLPAPRDGSPSADAAAIGDAPRSPDAPVSRDASPSPDVSADLPPRDAAQPDGAPASCIQAQRLWFEDFETGDYRRWTSGGYDRTWNGGMCHDNGFATDRAVSPTRSHRSVITCASSMDVHRGYGGMQFSGDMPLSGYTNSGAGIDARFGIVNTYWSYLDVPYSFENGRWFSFWTVSSSCNWTENVITLGLEDGTNRITPAHIANTGGTVTFSPGAPGFPLRRWARTTVYINYHDGRLHVWLDGKSVVDGRFTRPTKTVCHWHWGAYANGTNTDVTLYEDDNSIWKLGQPWTDFAVEPHLAAERAVCP